MTLSQNSYTFENAPHTVITDAAKEPLKIVEGKFFGVKGEAQIVDEPGAFMLECQITLSGYNTPALIYAAIRNLKNRRGKLTGTLTQTIDGSSVNFPQATFKEAEIVRAPWRGGQNGTWVAFVRLQWQQTGIS